MHSVPKRRSITFTGCWTCKARKIRCDERPSGCQNCELRGSVCGGYDIKLKWMTDPVVEPETPSKHSGQGRRRIGNDRGNSHRYHMGQIKRFLLDLDNDVALGVASAQDPFSTFPGLVRTPEHANVSLVPPRVLSVVLESQQESPLPAYSDESPVPLNQDPLEESVSETTASTTSSSSRSSNPHSPTGDAAAATNLVGHPLECLPLLQHVRFTFSHDNEVDVLIHHYGLHVADLLQPIVHTNNPYRELYFPSALEGAKSHASGGTEAIDVVQTALYHSIIASAAFHRWNCNKASDKYKQMGAHHRYHAICLLRSSVASHAPRPLYRLILMAVLSLITIGVISGAGDDYVVHLGATKELRRSRSRWTVLGAATRQLHEIAAFLGLMARTTSFRNSSTLWTASETEDKPSEDLAIESASCYEYMYGISPAIAAAIQDTCRYAEQLAWYRGQEQKHPPEDLLEACEALGERLLSWSSADGELALAPAGDDLMREVLNHHTCAWYHAALIYYYRRIQCFTAVDLVEEVDLVLEHMRAMEDFKLRPELVSSNRMAPITWPMFIASCEATPSKRPSCMEWWEQVKQYNLANIDKQCALIQLIWEKMAETQDRDADNVSWVDVYVTLGEDIIAV
ncbi:hypothetical protein CABS01_09823 [Colletotrichum abscissum]|nr:uncharacterized protein CABS01_09823 [Colletotrichum abscissum]KAK1501088.1 hypothetical protein CABS01_09823 [Colletotrichum abscissum]